MNKQNLRWIIYLSVALSAYLLSYPWLKASPLFFWISLAVSVIFQWCIPIRKIFDKAIDHFEPLYMFLFLFQLFHLIAPLYIFYHGPAIMTYGPRVPRPDGDTFDIAFMNEVLYYVNISVISCYIGYFILASPALPAICSKDLYQERDLNKSNFSKYLAWVMIAIGFISFWAIIRGNVYYYLTHLHQRAFFLKGHGYLLALSFFAAIGIFAYFCHVSLNTRYKILGYSLTILFLLGYLAQGSRGRVFIVILAMLLWYNYRMRKIPIKKILLLAIVIFSLFFSFHLFRINKAQNAKDEVDTQMVMRTMLVLRANHFMLVVKQRPPELLNGKSYLAPLMVWIPRFLLPDKPSWGVGRFYTDYYFPTVKERGSTFGPGIVGTALLNFNAFGVICNFIVFGFILKLLYRGFLKYYDNEHCLMVYVVTISIVVFFSNSQSMVNVITILPFFLVPLLFYLASHTLMRSILTKQETVSPSTN